MNNLHFPSKENVSVRKFGTEDPAIRQQTTIGANKIMMTLPDSTYFEDSRIQGSLLLDLKSRLNAKRITLQVIGEITYAVREPLNRTLSRNNGTIMESLDGYNRSTSLASVKRLQSINSSYARLNSSRNLNSTKHSSQIQSNFDFNHVTKSLSSKKITNMTTTFSSHPDTAGELVTSPTSQQALPLIPIDRSRTFLSMDRSRTLNRGLSRMNRSLSLRAHTKVHPTSQSATQLSSEVFCHYMVPLFTFKTKCPPGKYKLPFSFQFDELHAPSIFLRKDNLQLSIKYVLIAEVEEEEDDDSLIEESEDEDDDDKSSSNKVVDKPRPLLCKSVIDILWNYKLHTSNLEFYKETEHSKQWTYDLPRYFCSCLTYQAVAEIRIPKTIFTVTDVIPFTLKLSNINTYSKIDLKISLQEEVANHLIEFNEMTSAKLSTTMVSRKEGSNVLYIEGEIDFGIGVNIYSLISNDWCISHILEFTVITKALFGSKVEKFHIPCLIVSEARTKNIAEKRSTLNTTFLPTLKFLADDAEDDEPLSLPFCKFKLEHKFDIIKNRGILNEGIELE